MLKHIDVQEELTRCLRKLGAVVDDDFAHPNKPKNADYWFPSDNVIAELKCLSGNYFTDNTFQDWLNQTYHSWVSRGLARPLDTPKSIINLADLPPICYREVTSFIRKRVESSLKDASKQINSTKRTVGSDDASGLLFLVNDGNYGIVPAMLQSIAARSLHKYSGINTIIHFTANMPSDVPGINKDVLFWCAWSKSSIRASVSKEFLDKVQKAWFIHHGSVVGEEIETIKGSDKNLLNMTYIKG